MPPVEFWRGVRPRKAANSRPLAKALGSRTVATIAEAVIGPMPGSSSAAAPYRRLYLRLDLFVDGRDLRVDRVDLSGQRRQGLAHAIGNDDLAVLVVARRLSRRLSP